MKTLEEKEKEFKEYVISQINVLISPKCPTIDRGTRQVVHNLIQDFKEEIEGFNGAMEGELSRAKEELERYKEAFDVYYKAVHNEQ